MAPREDLVSSAVTFLQDPSVASSPIQKRIEFLQSKNLTQEEIDLALSRSSDESYQPTQYGGPPPQVQRYAPQQQQQQVYATRYPPYGQYGDWQMPPPELPRRDWRDWFIMATVTGGAAYGLYTLAKRYVAPLISPPTPPQLEADKAAIDEQFTRAFALLDTLSSDTATLKSAEEARTERLDRALEEVETVVAELKAATRRREDETRRLNDEIKGIREQIPKALDGHKESSDKRLIELGSELRSLKALMGNRFGQTSSSQPSTNTTADSTYPTSATSKPSDSTSPSPAGPPTYGNASSVSPGYQYPPTSSATSSTPTNPYNTTTTTSSRPGSGSTSFSLNGIGSSKATIPAWQMAAAARKTGAAGSESAPASSAATPATPAPAAVSSTEATE